MTWALLFLSIRRAKSHDPLNSSVKEVSFRCQAQFDLLSASPVGQRAHEDSSPAVVSVAGSFASVCSLIEHEQMKKLEGSLLAWWLAKKFPSGAAKMCTKTNLTSQECTCHVGQFRFLRILDSHTWIPNQIQLSPHCRSSGKIRILGEFLC